MAHQSRKRARIDGFATCNDTSAAGHRIIIALDLDAFYVSASRLRDPSLVGLPIGIKQKGILATCSYEARALGVQKLATVKESLKKCPDLILVNGEDLSFFRKLSNQVWRLVKSVVWGAKVEKLGLDELFCDVTDMVDSQSGPEGFFRLSQDDASVGFEYPNDGMFAGHVLPATGNTSTSHRLRLATRLAAHLRGRIEHEIGLTTSAGVAHNKLLAKLVCAKHKPAEQTVFAPRNDADVLQFLDSYETRALNGFGGVIVNTLRTALGGEKLGHSGTEWLNGGLGADPQQHIQDHRDGAAPPPLTVSLCRKAFSASQFNDLFGSRLGTRLWFLLHGQDDEPVIPAPPFPLQISIEDTYRNLRGADVFEQMQVLSESLMRRLEAELVDDEETVSDVKFELAHEGVGIDDPGAAVVRSYTETSKAQTSRAHQNHRSFKRYPLSVRLSIRQGWDNRVSKQTRMPVEIFDLTASRTSRAAALTTALTTLYRSMMQQYGDKGQGLNLINIAAFDLATHRPAPALNSFFAGGSRPRKISSDVDVETLRQLPEDIRQEVAAQYGLDLDLEGAAVESSPPNDAPLLICQSCGIEQFPWLQHDHSIWPIHGVAPFFVTDQRAPTEASWTADSSGPAERDERETIVPSSQQGH